MNPFPIQEFECLTDGPIGIRRIIVPYTVLSNIKIIVRPPEICDIIDED
jgi:hypothetical protein